MSIDKIKSRKLKKLSNHGTDRLKNQNVAGEVLEKMDFDSSDNDYLQKKKVKGKKLNISNTDLEEKELDKAIEREDNLSITVMILILVACFVVGGILGYMLYRIAINSSHALLVLPYLFR